MQSGWPARSAFALLTMASSVVCAEVHAACGDGVIDSGETCDDANAEPGDGCSASCQSEAGYLCTGTPSVCCFRDAAASFVLLASASYDASSAQITLTPDELWHEGTAWYRQRLDFAQPFRIALQLYLGAHDDAPSSNAEDTGADGGSLLFQRDPRGLSAKGAYSGPGGEDGRELGALGISPVLGVEFDTYNNGALFGDVTTGDEDHLSVFHSRAQPAENQLIGPVCMNAGPSCANYEDGRWHRFELTWSGNDTHLLGVSIDGVSRIELTGDIIADYFAGDTSGIWFGLAASTGGKHNVHKFCPLAPDGFGVLPDNDGDGVVDAEDAGMPDAGSAVDAATADASAADAGISNGLCDGSMCTLEGPIAGDLDGDGIDNANDVAPNDPCLPNAAALRCGRGDTDGDGLSNEFECPELRACRDTDGDLVADYADADSDGDGIADARECPDMNACPDADGDGTPDLLQPAAIRSDDGCTLASGRPFGLEWLALLACWFSARASSRVRSERARACVAR